MRIKQLAYQIYYRLHTPHLRDSQNQHLGKDLIVAGFLLPQELCFRPDNHGTTFQFLNRTHTFESQIDWNFKNHGKLWTYHLNYFDYLTHPSLKVEIGIMLIEQYFLERHKISDGMEPYPISLRGINWIHFFSVHNIHDYDSFLYDQYSLLKRSIEYHLLGNHLLENAISLAFAAIYFEQSSWALIATRILDREISEQILDDGGHFELSPMYHSIITFRLAQLYNLMKSNPSKSKNLTNIQYQIFTTLSSMGSWLKSFQFSDGSLACVNDASISMMPANSKELLSYLKFLGIASRSKGLTSSGYRRINTKNYEMLVDVGNIGPDYLPGHAHADSLNFVLTWHGQPLLVDTGTSTYETCETRNIERSTMSHNSVSVNDGNSSDVWAAFRVGRRAKTVILEERKEYISAIHLGYFKQGIKHKRTWNHCEDTLCIQDELISKKDKVRGKLCLHFHHRFKPSIENNQIILGGIIIITFSSDNALSVQHGKYNMAIEFNKVKEASMIIIHFSGSISTTFADVIH